MCFIGRGGHDAGKEESGGGVSEWDCGKRERSSGCRCCSCRGRARAVEHQGCWVRKSVSSMMVVVVLLCELLFGYAQRQRNQSPSEIRWLKQNCVSKEINRNMLEGSRPSQWMMMVCPLRAPTPPPPWRCRPNTSKVWQFVFLLLRNSRVSTTSEMVVFARDLSNACSCVLPCVRRTPTFITCDCCCCNCSFTIAAKGPRRISICRWVLSKPYSLMCCRRAATIRMGCGGGW